MESSEEKEEKSPVQTTKKNSAKKAMKKRKKNAFDVLKNAAKKKMEAAKKNAARKKAEAAAKRKKKEAKAKKSKAKGKKKQDLTREDLQNMKPGKPGAVNFVKYGKKPLLTGKDLRWALRPPNRPEEINRNDVVWRRKQDHVNDPDIIEKFDIPIQAGSAGQFDPIDLEYVKKLPMLDRFTYYRNSSQYARDMFGMAPVLGFERDFLGIEPRYSWNESSLTQVGNIKKTPFTKQDMKLHFPSYNEARKKQYGEFAWDLVCDPSAQTQIHHPDAQHHNIGFECIINNDPANINLRKSFGDKIEFIYISPPWNISHWGNGAEGFFTIEHLKKLPLRSVMDQGFLFMWAPFGYYNQICEVMQEKGFEWADSCGLVGVDLHKKVINEQRNPFADKSDYAGRMCGQKFHGMLFKCFERNTPGNWVLGNQIQKDIQFSRLRTNPMTGQFRYDHSFVYELFQRIVAEQPRENETIQAVHLYCDDTLRHKHWMGIMHYENPQFVEKSDFKVDFSVFNRAPQFHVQSHSKFHMPLVQHFFEGPEGHKFGLEQMDVEEEVESKA